LPVQPGTTTTGHLSLKYRALGNYWTLKSGAMALVNYFQLPEQNCTEN